MASSLTTRLVRLAAAGLVAVAVAGGVGAYPTWRLAGPEGLMAAAVGCGIAWLASVVGFIPGCVLMDRSPADAAKGFLAGSAIRFGAVVLFAAPVVVAGPLRRTPLLLWTGIAYMVVLAVDTVLVARLLKQSISHKNDNA